MKTLLKLFLILFLTSGIWSCSANWHLRKAISKDPDLLKPSHVTIYDTLLVQSVQHDTVFQFGLVKDTVVLVQDRLTIRYFYNNTDSAVYLQGECKADTIIKEIQVPCPEQVVYNNRSMKDQVLFWVFAITAFLQCVMIVWITRR